MTDLKRTMRITNIPLNVLNRALELYGQSPASTTPTALVALTSAESRIDVDGPYAPLAQALAEYMSLAGPWAEDGGEHAGESGYELRFD